MTVNAFRIKAVALAAGLAFAAGLPTAGSAVAGTLDEVKARGALSCGVNQGLRGFAEKTDSGDWSGFDVDFCRAVAAAIFDDPAKVSFVPLSAAERFEALSAGTVDLLSRNSTWTLEREAGLGLLFAGITYHDGQGFMVKTDLDVVSALELNGAKVCVQEATTSQLNLADYFRANTMTYTEMPFATAEEALAAFAAGECTVLTRDQSALFADRLSIEDGAAMILPDVISKEPLGPVTRGDDLAWYNLVKWVNFALVNAEELGITSGNVDAALASEKPDVRRFTGAEGDLGDQLGVDKAWAIRAIEAVGNYAEIYERNVGAQSALAIPRGLNHLWTMGGILYAPPLR